MEEREEKREKLSLTLSFRVTPSLDARIRAVARRRRVKENWLIREWVREGLEREERKGR